VASSGFNDLAASIDALPLDVVKIFLALAVSSLAALALLAINTAAQKAKPTSWIWLTRYASHVLFILKLRGLG
jgi:hypothetical protein